MNMVDMIKIDAIVSGVLMEEGTFNPQRSLIHVGHKYLGIVSIRLSTSFFYHT